MEITIGKRLKHIPSGDTITVIKINRKTYNAKSEMHSRAAYVRVQKTDCEL